MALGAAGTPKPQGAGASEGASFSLGVHLRPFAWAISTTADWWRARTLEPDKPGVSLSISASLGLGLHRGT